MMTGPPARDDRHNANGHREPADAAGQADGDPADGSRASLAAFWALVLQRFRDYALRTSDLPVRPQRHGQDSQ
jgi:hypothetical protein